MNIKTLSVLAVILLFSKINITLTQWSKDNSVIYKYTVISVTENEKFIFIGTSKNGIYRTLKTKIDWKRISENHAIDNLIISSIAVYNNIILAGTKDKGLFRSENNGDTWSGTNITNYGVQAILVKDNYIFAGLAQNKGVYRSSDSGKSFIPYNNGMGNKHIYSLAHNDTFLFAGTNGVYISANNGESWINANLESSPVGVYALFTDKEYIYAGTEKNGIYLSTNSGKTWDKTSFNSNVSVFSFSKRYCYLYASTYQKGVCVLDRNGEVIGSEYYNDPYGATVYRVWFLNNYIYAGAPDVIYKRKLAGPYQN